MYFQVGDHLVSSLDMAIPIWLPKATAIKGLTKVAGIGGWEQRRAVGNNHHIDQRPVRPYHPDNS